MNETPSHETVAVIWKPRPEFGPLLRRLREERALSLRGAAEALGVAFSYLQRIETNQRAKAPSLALIQRASEVFGVPYGELLAEAGIELNAAPELPGDGVDDVFRAVALHPRLRPMRLSVADLDYYSPLQKRQVLEMLQRLQAHLVGGGSPLEELSQEES